MSDKVNDDGEKPGSRSASVSDGSSDRGRLSSVDLSRPASEGGNIRSSASGTAGGDRPSPDDIPAPTRITRTQSLPSNPSKPLDTEPTRPRANTAPAKTAPPKEPFKTEASIKHQVHERKWISLGKEPEDPNKPKENGIQKPKAELEVKTTVNAGISKDGILAEADISVDGKAELAAHLKGKLVGQNVTADAKATVAGKASLGAAVNIGKKGILAEAGGKAEASAKATAQGGVDIDDKHAVAAGYEAEAFAKAKAIAKLNVSASKGAEASADLSAGAGVKLGPNVVLRQGDNCYAFKPRVVLGKVGAGASVGVTNEPGKIGYKANLTVNIGVGLELASEISYDTKQISAAGRKAGEALQRRLDGFKGRPTETHNDRAAIIHNATAIPGGMVDNFGKELVAQGRNQGGVVGAFHQGAGYAAQGLGKGAKVAGKVAGGVAAEVSTGAIKVANAGSSAWRWVKGHF